MCEYVYCVLFVYRLKSEMKRRAVEREEEVNKTQSKHSQELVELQNQLQDQDNSRQALQEEASELRARIESLRQQHKSEDEFNRELQQRYDRDMATLEEEFNKTKQLYQAVSDHIAFKLLFTYPNYLPHLLHFILCSNPGCL